jgi:hypothetical protein
VTSPQSIVFAFQNPDAGIQALKEGFTSASAVSIRFASFGLVEVHGPVVEQWVNKIANANPWLQTLPSSNNGGTVGGVSKSAVASSSQVPASVQNQTKSVVAPLSQTVTYAALTLNAQPSSGGRVSGGGDFASGSSRTVTAMPNNGFVFECWTENGRAVSLSASYNFILHGNRSLVANFRQNFVNHPLTQSPSPNSQNKNSWSIETSTPNTLYRTNRFWH